MNLHLFEIKQAKKLKQINYNSQTLEQLCSISTATSAKTQEVQLSLQQFYTCETYEHIMIFSSKNISTVESDESIKVALPIFHMRWSTDKLIDILQPTCAIFYWLVLEYVSEVRLHKNSILVNALSGTTLQSKRTSYFNYSFSFL